MPGLAIKSKLHDMKRLLNFLLIILIISNVLLAFTIVIAPRASMVLLESFLGNPYNLETPSDIGLNKVNAVGIELVKPASGTIESK